MPTLRIDNVPVTIGYQPLTIGGPDPEPLQAPEGTYFFECRDGQHLSQIIHQELGYINSEILLEVLKLNPGLAGKPLMLQIGTTIILPVKTETEVPAIEVKTLW